MDSGKVIEAFEVFREELDYKHNLYENVVKKSRDVTIQSKRLIFHLHRIKNEKSREKLIKDAEEKLIEIEKIWREIAVLLMKDDSQAYKRAYSAGLQEFIEAVEFLNFFKTEDQYSPTEIHKCILGINGIQEKLNFKIQQDDNEVNYQIDVPISEYLLGIADVTGEAMRMCITSAAVASSADLNRDFAYKRSFKLLSYINIMQSAFANFSTGVASNKYWKDKLNTMSSSLHKVEDACYQLKLQNQEKLLLGF